MLKQVLIASTLLLTSSFLLTSCKYEDGPLLSTQSRQERVANVWEVAYATDDEGDEATEQYESWEMTFEEDGQAFLSYQTSAGEVSFDGEWNLVDRDNRFQLLIDDPFGLFTADREYEIEKLTRDEFWLRDTEDEDRVIELSGEL